MSVKVDLATCLTLMSMCGERPRTGRELRHVARISRATFFRALHDVREHLQAEIARDTVTGKYTLKDWGIINGARLPKVVEWRWPEAVPARLKPDANGGRR